MNTIIARKATAIVAMLVIAALVTWFVAWNLPAFNTAIGFLTDINNIGNIFITIIGLLALYFVIFWPKRLFKDKRVEEVVRAVYSVAIVVLAIVAGATKFFGIAGSHFPWLVLLGLIAVIVVFVALFSAALLDHPFQAWKARFKRD